MANPQWNENRNQGGTIWNHDNGYKVESATETSMNSWLDNFLDPTGLVSGFWNDITGATSQSREFSQQEYLQDKQNWYNHPINQMARYKAAGINANTAAAGITQGGNESAQAPAVSSNTSGAAQGLSAAGAAAGAVTGGIGSLAAAGLASAQAGEITALLDFKKNQFAAETAKTWIDAGMDSHMANYWSVKAAYAGAQERLDLSQKSWAINKVKKEILKLNEDITYRKKEIDLIRHQISSADYKQQMDAIDLFFQQERKRIYDEVGVDITLPENAMLVEASEAGTLDEVAAAFGKGAFETSKAAYDADAATIEERTRKRVSEELSAKLQEIWASKDMQEELIRLGIKGEVAKHFMDFIFKYLFGTGVSATVGPFSFSNSNP